MFNRASSALWIAGLLAIPFVSACYNVNPKTDRIAPREHQRYFFSEVVEKSKQLVNGMSKRDVLFLLGSAAEKSDHLNTWVYLPERIGVLLPARALRLEFEGGLLKNHGFYPIILGQQL